MVLFWLWQSSHSRLEKKFHPSFFSHEIFNYRPRLTLLLVVEWCSVFWWSSFSVESSWSSSHIQGVIFNPLQDYFNLTTLESLKLCTVALEQQSSQFTSSLTRRWWWEATTSTPSLLKNMCLQQSPSTWISSTYSSIF